jgi:hypothetical protein
MMRRASRQTGSLTTTPRPSPWRSKVVADQAAAAVIGLALLAGSALLRYALENQRTRKDAGGAQLVRQDPESEKTLGSLAVTFPRLTLGGLRGIASTVLWIQAEEDKNDRKWVDLETKYDLIGALQPYFASVYVYHAWNQAYNLSAQWQEQETKYKWVLDGIAYLDKGEEFNPGNPDIIYEESRLYCDKLGLAAERLMYRAHWRNDISRLHELNGKPETKDDATVALQHVREFVTRRDPRDPPWTANDDPAKRSYYHTEELPDPMQRAAGTGWGLRIYPDIDPRTGFNLFAARGDGKRPTEPMDFRYGLSPFYFAYIEYKRGLALPVGPTYTAVRVIDAWPAMSLRLWCRDDLYYTGDTMRKLFGPTPDKALLASAEAFNDKVQEIHDCYRNIQMVAPRAIDLFQEHLGRYPENRFIHTKHILEAASDKEISKAEIALFDALVAWQNNGRKLDDQDGSIRRKFMQADDLYKAAYPVTLQWVDNMYPIREGEPVNPDRADFERYANELQTRSRGIEALLTTPAEREPDMSFLGPEHDVVER